MLTLVLSPPRKSTPARVKPIVILFASISFSLVGCDTDNNNVSRVGDGADNSNPNRVRQLNSPELESTEKEKVIEKSTDDLSSGVKNALEFARAIDPSTPEERELFVDLILEELEANGVDTVVELSSAFVDGRLTGEISSLDLDILGQAVSKYYFSRSEELELADILDASLVETDQNNKVHWVATAISSNAVSVEYPKEATLSLLRKQPKLVKSMYTAIEVFSDASAAFDPDEVLALLPREIEKSTVFDEALRIFIMRKNMLQVEDDGEAMELFFENKSNSFRQRSYYHLASTALGYSDVEVAEIWLQKIDDPRLRQDVEIGLEVARRRSK